MGNITQAPVVYCNNCKFARVINDNNFTCMLNPPTPYPIINQVPGLDPKIVKVEIQIMSMRPPVIGTDFCVYGRAKSESELVR